MPERTPGNGGGAMDTGAILVRAQDDAMGGARAERVWKCARMAAITRGSVITASTRSCAPQRGQRLMSILNTRRRRCIQVIESRLRDGALSAWLPRGAGGGEGEGTTRRRWRAFGAKMPWNWMRWPRGRGTRAARRAMKSSGSNSTWVVAVAKGVLQLVAHSPSPSRLRRSSAKAGRTRRSGGEPGADVIRNPGSAPPVARACAGRARGPR